jgi:hypothetical protein
MSSGRSNVAVLMGLFAWAVFGVMLVAPWFEDEDEFLFSARFYYAWPLTPVVFVLALVGFLLADGTGRAALVATWLSVLVALALLLYWAVPWVWNAFFGGSW